MKGGGLTWVGWLMVGVGGMLVYAGMTGGSLTDELGAVLSGKASPSSSAYEPGGSVADSQVPAVAPVVADDPQAAARDDAARRSIPWPAV